MKISNVEPIVLNIPLKEPVETSFGTMTSRTTILVRIETETGEYGVGEIWNNFPSWGVYEKLATLKYGITPLLIGEDPREITKVNEKLFHSCTILGLQWGALGPIYQCISGIDIALWDLVGRYQGKSIAQLLGGKQHSKVKVYASGLGPAQFESMVRKHQEMGVNAFKLKVGKNDDHDLANIQEIRQMLNQNERLMIDANQAWNREDAIRNLKLFKNYDLTWIEEPLRCDDLEGMQIVREQAGLPVAAGENIYGQRHTEIALKAQALDILQPDLSKNGGISEARKMVASASNTGISYAPHFLGGAICLAASIHFIASIPGGRMLELDANPNPFREKLFTTPITIKGGYVQVPDGPGLGFELDLDFINHYRVNANEIIRDY